MRRPINAGAIYQRIKTADVSKQDWESVLLLDAEDVPKYWRGYFQGRVEEMWNALSSNHPDFKFEILQLMRDCWKIED